MFGHRIRDSEDPQVIQNALDCIRELQQASIKIEEVSFRTMGDHLLNLVTPTYRSHYYRATQVSAKCEIPDIASTLRFLRKLFVSHSDYLLILDRNKFGFHFDEETRLLSFLLPTDKSIPAFLTELAKKCENMPKRGQAYHSHGYRTR